MEWICGHLLTSTGLGLGRAGLRWTQVEARVGVAAVDATEAGRVAARHAVVRVLPIVVSKERLLRHGQYLGGGPALLTGGGVLGHRRQTAGLVGPRSMFSVLVLSREAVTADRRLGGLAAAVIVWVDGVVVVHGQLTPVVRQKFRISEMLIEFVRD